MFCGTVSWRTPSLGQQLLHSTVFGDSFSYRWKNSGEGLWYMGCFFEGLLSDLFVTSYIIFTCHHVSFASFQPRHWENFILKKARKIPEPQLKPLAKLSTGKYGLVGVSDITFSTKTSLFWWKIDFSGSSPAEKLCRQQFQSTAFQRQTKVSKKYFLAICRRFCFSSVRRSWFFL